MAGEYDINLSNGSILTILYPLETNGPNNRSTPRLIQDVQVGSPSGFVLAGDLTYRFVEGFVFDVQNSGANDGTYMVAAGGSTGIGSPITQTFIPVEVGSPALNPGLPYGQIQYSVPNDAGSPPQVGSPHGEVNVSLSLPGKGTVNYGEMIIENLVRMTEHWAADDSPNNNAHLGDNPYAVPLVGQLWYKTLPGDEGFKFWNGSQWTDLAGGGLDNVVEDLTPQLGGDLDVNGFSIVSVSDGHVVVAPDGVGNLQVFQANIELTGAALSGYLQIYHHHGIIDDLGNESLLFDRVGGAAEYFSMLNSVTGGPYLTAEGSTTNIDLNLRTKGTGGVAIHGAEATANPGRLRLYEGYTNGFSYVELAAPAALAGTVAYTLPDAYPASDGYVLASTTAGVMSWTASATPGGTGSPNNAIQFNDNGSFGGSSNLTWDGVTLTVTGTGSPQPAIIANGDIDINSSLHVGTLTVNVDSIKTVDGVGADPGGSMTMRTGDGGASGAGGAFTITTGAGNATSGGDFTITTGAGTGVRGGNFSVTTGNGSGGPGGSFTITTGGGSTTSGGDFTITTGAGTGVRGGDFNLTTGNGTSSGDINLTTGTSSSGSGGFVRVTTGNGTSGGPIDFFSGNATSGNNRGGQIALRGGDGHGSGLGADIVLQPGGGATDPDLLGAILLIGQSGGNSGVELRFREGSTSGLNYFGIKAPDTIADSFTYTLPPPATGSPIEGTQFLTVDESGIMSWVEPASSGAQEQRYDLAPSAFGTISDGTLFGQFVAVVPFTIQAASGSPPETHGGYAVTAPGGSPATGSPLGSALINVTKNGVSIGTLTFNSGSNSLSSATIVETSVDAGDRIQFTLVYGNGIEDFSVTLGAIL